VNNISSLEIEKGPVMFLHSTLHKLSETRSGPHISLFLPTKPSSDSTVDGALHLKNLLKDAHVQLRDTGVSAEEADSLLAPAQKLVAERPYWQHQQHGLALFLAPSTFSDVSVDHTLEPRAVVGETFDVLPLMPGLTSDDFHTLVCASQDAVTVYRADAIGLEAIGIPGMPKSLEDVLTDDDYENPVLASPTSRPNLGTHNMSNSQVYGAAPPEWQAMVRRKFAERVASSLNGHQEIAGLTLILIADTELAGDLGPAIGADAVIPTHPESRTEPQRHAASWQAAEPFADRKRLIALESLAAHLGQGNQVTTNVEELAHAANEGRVSLMAVATAVPNPTISGALWATIKTGGTVIWAGDAIPPLTTDVAALLRY
jgi:hypothetical protein